MNQHIDSLPIRVNPEVRDNPYVMTGLAQRAFRLASYDMTPDDAVNLAFERGYLAHTDEGSSNLQEEGRDEPTI